MSDGLRSTNRPVRLSMQRAVGKYLWSLKSMILPPSSGMMPKFLSKIIGINSLLRTHIDVVYLDTQSDCSPKPPIPFLPPLSVQ